MRRILISVAVLLLAVSAGCGSGSSSSAGSAGAPVDGGTLRGAIPDNPDHLDTGIPQGLVLYGPVDQGKTGLAIALLKELNERGAPDVLSAWAKYREPPR